MNWRKTLTKSFFNKFLNLNTSYNVPRKRFTYIFSDLLYLGTESIKWKWHWWHVSRLISIHCCFSTTEYQSERERRRGKERKLGLCSMTTAVFSVVHCFLSNVILCSVSQHATVWPGTAAFPPIVDPVCVEPSCSDTQGLCTGGATLFMFNRRFMAPLVGRLIKEFPHMKLL